MVRWARTKSTAFTLALIAIGVSFTAIRSSALADAASHFERVVLEDGPEDCVTECDDIESEEEGGVPKHAAPYTSTGATNYRGTQTHSHQWEGACEAEYCSGVLYCSGWPDITCDCSGDMLPAKHPACGGGANFAMVKVESALRTGDPDAIAALLARGDAEYVADRRAIQVTDCRGNVIGHFPITGELAAVFAG